MHLDLRLGTSGYRHKSNFNGNSAATEPAVRDTAGGGQGEAVRLTRPPLPGTFQCTYIVPHAHVRYHANIAYLHGFRSLSTHSPDQLYAN